MGMGKYCLNVFKMNQFYLKIDIININLFRNIVLKYDYITLYTLNRILLSANFSFS